MTLKNDFTSFNINEHNKLKNGTVNNYVNYYWLVKDGKFFKAKRGSYLCNMDKRLLESLQKNIEDFQSCEIKKIPIICLKPDI